MRYSKLLAVLLSVTLAVPANFVNVWGAGTGMGAGTGAGTEAETVTVSALDGETADGETAVSESQAEEPDEGMLQEGTEEIEYDSTLESVETLAEAKAKLLQLMAARDFETYFYGPRALQSITQEELFDLNEEREGMKPWEGDYMNAGIGSKTGASYNFSQLFTVKYAYENKDSDDEILHYAYRADDIFITTKAQEEAVTKKIGQIFAGNSELAKANRSGSEDEKIRAAYDYVRDHVSSSTGDRTKPIKHTAYNALINGDGTCEACATLLYRLLREMGIPNKVICGTNASNHAYNIVQFHEDGEEVWYYCDSSAGYYKKSYNSFKRAEEQPRYQTPVYIRNYISKIKGYGETTNYILSLNYKEAGEDKVEKFAAPAALFKRLSEIEEEAEAADASDDSIPEYTVKLGQDIRTSSDLYFSYRVFEKIYPHITLEMNDKTITFVGNDTVNPTFRIHKVKNGILRANTNTYLFIGGEDAHYENVKIIGCGKQDRLTVGDFMVDDFVQMHVPDYWAKNVRGDLTLDEDCEISGFDTTMVSQPRFVSKGSIKAKNFWYDIEHIFLNPPGTSEGPGETSPDSMFIRSMTVEKNFEVNSPVTIYVEKMLTAKGGIRNKAKSCGICLKKDDEGSMASLSVSGTLKDEKSVIALRPYEGDGYDEEDIAPAAFEDGDKIVTLSNVKGSVGKNGTLASVTAQTLRQYLELTTGEDLTIYSMGGSFYAGKPYIFLYENDDPDPKQSFILYSDCIQYMKTNGADTSEYTIGFKRDADLGGALTFPAKGKKFTYRSETGENVTLKFTGGIKLTRDTAFKDIDFVSLAADKKTSTMKVSPISLAAGKYALLMDHCRGEGEEVEFAAVNSANKLTFADTAVNVSGGTKAKIINIMNAVYRAEGGGTISELGFSNSGRYSHPYSGNTLCCEDGKALKIGAINDTSGLDTVNLISYNRDVKKKTPAVQITGKYNSLNKNQLHLKMDGSGSPAKQWIYTSKDVDCGDHDTVKVSAANAYIYCPMITISEVVLYEDSAPIDSLDKYVPVKVNGMIVLISRKTTEDRGGRTALSAVYILDEAGYLVDLCLDLNQASMEIEKLGDPNREYSFLVGGFGFSADPSYVIDMNLTDKAKYSPLKLPKKGCKSIFIMGPYYEGGLKTPMWFTGSVTSTVDLGIVNLDVRSKKPAKGKNPESDAEFGITLKAGKGAKEPPMLWMERVETGGTLTKLTGVNLKGTLSKLYLTDCGEIVLKAAPANFDAKDLTGTTVKYKDRAGVMHSWP